MSNICFKKGKHMSKGKRIYINIWDNCNLQCRHCFNNSGKGKGALLSFSEIIDLTEKAQSLLGIQQIQLTGGEPLQRPDIFPIINELLSRGLNVLLQTNGVFDDHSLRKLLDLPEKHISLIISLDGISTNDYFRGKRSTEKTIYNIKVLSQKFKIRINSVLTSKINWEEIEQLAELANKFNCFLAFNPVCPTGRADQALLMPINQYFEWMYKLEVLRHQGIKLRKSFDIINEQLVEYENCPVRTNPAVHIGADGDVYPCGYLINNTESYAGNIKKNSLTELIDMLPPVSKKLAKQCIQCHFYIQNYCHGGCPARIYALHNRFGEVEYYCMAEYLNR